VKALELSKDAKDRLAELRALSDKAENGDKGARRELRKAVRESPREVVDEASELAKRGQWALIKTAAAGEPLKEEALVAMLELMRFEVGGPNPTPLESLLTERVISLWILVELLDLLNGAQLTNLPKDRRVPHSYLRFYLGWQEQAHRRFLGAIRELAKVRRLQSGIPKSQTNIQVNLG
jgi:hypothetical protein